MHPTLTLDLGLRYAFYPPLTDDGDMLFTFSPDAYDPAQAPDLRRPRRRLSSTRKQGICSTAFVVAGKDSPYGRAIYAADNNNLQPRVGAAWDPGGDGRLFVRAGYGMYYDQTQVEMFAESCAEFSITTRFARTSSSATRRSRIPDAQASVSPKPLCAVLHALDRWRPAIGLWHRDGSIGTSACSDGCTPPA